MFSSFHHAVGARRCALNYRAPRRILCGTIESRAGHAAMSPGTGRQFGSQARKRLECGVINAQAPERGERRSGVSSAAHFVGLVHTSPPYQRLTPLATELSPTSWAAYPGLKPWAIDAGPFHGPRKPSQLIGPLGAGVNSPGLLARGAFSTGKMGAVPIFCN